MNENEISYSVRGAIFSVYNSLGPGLLESIYCKALEHELAMSGFIVESEKPIHAHCAGHDLGVGLRLDLLVEEKVIIEVKSVEHIAKVHHKQLLTYLRQTDLKLGIFVNFNCSQIKDNIFRKVNNLQSY